MQGALVVIFAGSVTLAAVVCRHRQDHGITSMAGSREFGRATINLPSGWVLKHSTNDQVLFVAQEPDRQDRLGRTLTGRREKLPAAVEPMEYLQKSDLLDESSRVVSVGPDITGIEALPMGGCTGVLLQIHRVTGDPSSPEESVQWIACCVRPSGLAVTLVMECPPTDDPEMDKQTLHDIASSLQISE